MQLLDFIMRRSIAVLGLPRCEILEMSIDLGIDRVDGRCGVYPPRERQRLDFLAPLQPPSDLVNGSK
jgi:hypothetical protein